MKKNKKQTGDAKGKASFDENGKGNSPKYGKAGDKPNESAEPANHVDAQKKS